MEELYWIATFISGAICTGTGMLAWRKNPGSMATRIFLAASITTTIAMLSARLAIGVGEADSTLATVASKVFSSSLFISMSLYWQLSVLFPFENSMKFRPPNFLGAVFIATLVASLSLGCLSEPDFSTSVGTTVISRTPAALLLGGFLTMSIMSTLFTLLARNKASRDAMHSATIYVIGLWMVTVSGVVYCADIIIGHQHSPDVEFLPRMSLIVVITAVMLYFASLMVRGRMTIALGPMPERMASAAKTQYHLLQRRVYLVEEPKPVFSLKLFADILKGRCYDCEDDDSFTCESLDCGACSLPCPCKGCKKYKSRTQGLVVTRLFPTDVRKRYFLQTTPILWLSTVAGKDNMDPAKLSVLTDFLVTSMEKSQNGVVLVDGIEYLITSNDFQRVLRSIDRWTETAMTSSTRLIITLDPGAFDEKELAMLERNKEVVRPAERESWRVIPEPI